MKMTHKFLLSAMAALTMIAPCDAMLRHLLRPSLIATACGTAAAPAGMFGAPAIDGMSDLIYSLPETDLYSEYTTKTLHIESPEITGFETKPFKPPTPKPYNPSCEIPKAPVSEADLSKYSDLYDTYKEINKEIKAAEAEKTESEKGNGKRKWWKMFKLAFIASMGVAIERIGRKIIQLLEKPYKKVKKTIDESRLQRHLKKLPKWFNKKAEENLDSYFQNRITGTEYEKQIQDYFKHYESKYKNAFSKLEENKTMTKIRDKFLSYCDADKTVEEFKNRQINHKTAWLKLKKSIKLVSGNAKALAIAKNAETKFNSIHNDRLYGCKCRKCKLKREKGDMS